MNHLVVLVFFGSLFWLLIGYAFTLIRFKWLDGYDYVVEGIRASKVETALEELRMSLPLGVKIKDVSPLILTDLAKSVSDNITPKQAIRSFLIQGSLAGIIGIAVYLSSRFLQERLSPN